MKITHSDKSLQFQWSSILWSHSRQVPCDRFHHASCTLGRHLYVFGGKEKYAPLKDFWRLDMATQTWDKIMIKETPLPHLQGHTMVAYKCQLLIFGGTFHGTNDSCPLWIFNTDLNLVRTVSSYSGSEQPTDRREHTAVIYKNAMYIYGGFLDNSGSTDEMWVFNIEQEEWSPIPRKNPGKRHGHVAVVPGRSMWIHGGMKNLKTLSDLWLFHFALSTWKRVKGVGTSPALSGHSASLVNNAMILVGGTKQGGLHHEGWLFNFDTLSWSQILTQTGNLFPAVSLHSCVLINTSSLQDMQSDRTQSVPQLRGKPLPQVDADVRPWTSPRCSQEGNQSYANGEMMVSSDAVNILTLEPLGTMLDSNNNKSEEDVFGAAAGDFSPIHGHSKKSDDKTHPFLAFTDNFISINPPLIDSKSETETFEMKLIHQIRDPRISAFKSRPVSVEYCGDQLPLLERFQSVNSDTDIGENNVTLTLSDEKIYNPNSFHGRVQTFDGLSSTTFEKSAVSVNNFHHGADKQFLGECAVTYDLKHSYPANRCTKAASDLSSGMQMVTQKPAKTMVHKKALTNEHLSFGTEETSVDVSAEEIKVDAPYVQTPHTKSTIVDDLFLEDLEFSDFSSVFENVKLNYPSSNLINSLSVTDIHKLSSDSHCIEMENHRNSQLSRERAKSCGSLTVDGLTAAAVKRFSSGNSIGILKDSVNKLPSVTESVGNSGYSRKPLGVKGKYVKYTGTGGGKSVAQNFRSKSCASKAAMIMKHSVGTQTGSQPLLRGDQHIRANSQTSVSAEPDREKFAEEATCGLSMPFKTRKNDIISHSQLFMLLIGGQSENSGFQSESLRVWKCHLC